MIQVNSERVNCGDSELFGLTFYCAETEWKGLVNESVRRDDLVTPRLKLAPPGCVDPFTSIFHGKQIQTEQSCRI